MESITSAPGERGGGERVVGGERGRWVGGGAWRGGAEGRGGGFFMLKMPMLRPMCWTLKAFVFFCFVWGVEEDGGRGRSRPE